MNVKRATSSQAPGYPSRRQYESHAKALGLMADGVGSLLAAGCWPRTGGVMICDPPTTPVVEAPLAGDIVVEPRPEEPISEGGVVHVEPAQP